MNINDVFGVNKPVIGMVHLLAMPTDPKYDEVGGLEKVIDRARRDLMALQNGGIDAVLFCNEFSIPYSKKVSQTVVASMARIIGELKKDITVPFGVDVAIDPYATFDLAAATGAKFVRETFSGVYAGEYGLHISDYGDIERHRKLVGCMDVPVLTTLVPEGESDISNRDITTVAQAIEHLVNPAALLVYGLKVGKGVDYSTIKEAKKVVETSVMASNGVNLDTIETVIKDTDGCVVGTYFKYDGKFFNETDENRVRELMDKAKKLRG